MAATSEKQLCPHGFPDLQSTSGPHFMQLGIWTPLPHTIRPEPVIETAVGELSTRGKGQPLDRSYAFARDIVRNAEDMGFDITLVAERLVAPDLEAWAVSAALAVETSRIKIMTAVHPGIFNPQLAAKMGATIDRLSGGRFVVNVVPGRRSHEFALYGNNAWLDGDTSDDRYTRVDEFIRLMKAMWLEDDFTFDGDFYTAKNATMATRTMTLPHPPVYAASGDERGKDIIARECDLWFANYEPGIGAYEMNARQMAADIIDMRERAASHGRSIGYGVSTHVACGDDVEALIADARSLENHPEHNVAIKALGAGLIGTPQMIADRIRRYEDMGLTCLMLQFHPMQQGLQIFADRVMPLIGR
jgi:FMNH2-dependent dimethyl sulfone monooxygenase